MSRTDIPENERKDFYLYVDEFQNFATESFATILSEARKYRLNLIVGHQYIGQLVQEKNTKVRDAIFGNVGTLVVFRVGAEDAEFLVKEFEPIFTEVDIVNLPKYQILLKLMINGVASDPFSAITLPPNPEYLTGNSEKTIKVSRERYSNPVSEVEEKISRWMGAEYHQDSALMIGGNEQTTEAGEATEPKLSNEAIVEKPIPVSAKQNFIKPANESPNTKPPQRPQQNPGFQKAPERDKRSQNSPNFRQPNKPQRGNFDSRPKPVKKENPIWNTVASLQNQKLEEQKKAPAPAVDNLIKNENGGAGTDRKILKPGEVEKVS